MNYENIDANMKRIIKHLREQKVVSYDLSEVELNGGQDLPNNLFSGIDKAGDKELDEVSLVVVNGDGSVIVKVGNCEMKADGSYYSKEGLLKAVDDYNNGKSNMGFRSVESLIEEITLCTKRKKFVDNVVSAYEEYKYRAFYTKGIIYDSIDRKLSSNVIISMLGGDYECVENDTTSVKIVIPDSYTTTIRMKMEEGELHVDVSARGMFTPKVNKQAMEILATVIFNRLYD